MKKRIFVSAMGAHNILTHEIASTPIIFIGKTLSDAEDHAISVAVKRWNSDDGWVAHSENTFEVTNWLKDAFK